MLFAGYLMRFDMRNSRSWPRCRAVQLVAILALVLSSGPRAAAQSDDVVTEAGLSERIRSEIQTAALGEQIGVSLLDVQSGRVLFAHNANLPLNPASNMKLITAAASLVELGADFRMLTGLYGQVQGDAVVSGLYLKGYGDPTLQTADLVALAQQLVARGVTKVDEVVVDGSYFDDQILPPGFGEQPAEVAPFRSAVAAASVNANAYTIRINPGAEAGASATVWLDAEGYFALTNAVTTSATGAANVVVVQNQRADKLALRVTGSVPLGIAGVTYRRRVESPLYFAGYTLVEALRAQHIQVPRRVRLAAMPKGTALLASRQSPPLSEILSALGKHSDNFVAEMLLKVLAAERVGAPGRSAIGASTALQALKRMNVPIAGLQMTNGSGLFGDSRVSAGQLTKLLAAMYADVGLRPEYLSQLAVAGVDGTLARRLTQLPMPRIVRAKTGTLDDVIALSGYVFGRSSDRVVAFSVLCNGVRGKQAGARALSDRIAELAAQHVWAPERHPSTAAPE